MKTFHCRSGVLAAACLARRQRQHPGGPLRRDHRRTSQELRHLPVPAAQRRVGAHLGARFIHAYGDQALSIDVGLQAHTGKHQGFGGGAALRYAF
ncbi:hypothetical protein CDEN61S_02130 [Castellaniella denitrificans]